MCEKILILLVYLFLNSYCYSAKEPIDYNIGILNDLSKINPHLESGNFEIAIELLKIELKKNKSDVDVYNLLGYAYRKIKNFKFSIKNYKRALVLDREHIGAHNYMGITFLKIGQINTSKIYPEKLNRFVE